MADLNKKYKRFIINVTHRGYPLTKECTAKSAKEAAEKFGCSLSFINGWALKTVVESPIDGVVAYIDSGYIPFDYGRTDLIRKIMPWTELKSIIDFYVNKKYEKTW